MKTEDIFDLNAPIKVARKSLDKWLARERLYLPVSAKNKAAVKLARIFANDDADNPALYQNFLNMIVHEEDDDDDINTVQTELKHIISSAYSQRKIIALSGILVALIVGLLTFVITDQRIILFSEVGTISSAQEDQLKTLVNDIVVRKQAQGIDVSHAQIWEPIKSYYKVDSYRDIPAYGYKNSKNMLLQQREE